MFSQVASFPGTTNRFLNAEPQRASLCRTPGTVAEVGYACGFLLFGVDWPTHETVISHFSGVH